MHVKNKDIKNILVGKVRGAARIFLRGGAKVMEAQSLEKENLFVIRIVKEST